MRAKMAILGLLAAAWWTWAIRQDPYPARSGPTASEVQAHRDEACESLWRLHQSPDRPEWMVDEPWCSAP